MTQLVIILHLLPDSFKQTAIGQEPHMANLRKCFAMSKMQKALYFL
jgi:hypothetical protein